MTEHLSRLRVSPADRSPATWYPFPDDELPPEGWPESFVSQDDYDELGLAFDELRDAARDLLAIWDKSMILARQEREAFARLREAAGDA